MDDRLNRLPRLLRQSRLLHRCHAGILIRRCAIKMAALTAALALLALAAGCQAFSAEQGRVYDDNTRIARQGDTYSFLSRVGSSTSTAMAITFASFTGKQTIWTLEAPDSATVELDVDAKITGGRFKVCLIDPSRAVVSVFEGSRKEMVRLAVPKGRSEVALIGRDARGELAIAWASLGSVKIRRTDSD